MADRKVTASGKGIDGDIVQLCQSGAAWSPTSQADAINEIESNQHCYYVEDDQGRRADLHVAGFGAEKYLRTDPDATCDNDLHRLPDC